MQIEVSGSSELTIRGNIKSIEDSTRIKEAIVALKKGEAGIQLKVPESFSMTSTVIGFLMKLVNVDRVRIALAVGDQRLYQLMEELSLVETFNVSLLHGQR
ncbi:hypothetical protein GMLC_07480 [Geomonas limicola]|uniref:STAS domain-containing protein n=1 Tax=Geomonas limicola TaxID=2740186 RepID=A0A6V8N7B1_9BACT|nr:hypothetical protein [Geomonas limicola]GFO67169.1 hypothetical protein GMLC_07480 [Geomonas limicola]